MAGTDLSLVRDTPETAADDVSTAARALPGREDADACYRAYSQLIFHVVRGKFGVPDVDAENIVQEVFLAYLTSGDAVRDTRAWLVAVACNASRRYWRLARRDEALEEDSLAEDAVATDPTEELSLRVTMEKTLSYLSEEYRQLLVLHYFDGRTAREIAALLGKTHRYTEKLLHLSLARARSVFLELTAMDAETRARATPRDDAPRHTTTGRLIAADGTAGSAPDASQPGS